MNLRTGTNYIKIIIVFIEKSILQLVNIEAQSFFHSMHISSKKQNLFSCATGAALCLIHVYGPKILVGDIILKGKITSNHHTHTALI